MMESQNMENDVFGENVEPEMMCVGQASSSPILTRKVANVSTAKISSVLSRRLQDNPDRHIMPLKIDTDKDTLLPQSAESDNRFDDVFDSPDGQGPGLERLYKHVYQDFDDATDETPEDGHDSRNATHPIAIPSNSIGMDSRLQHFESLSEASGFASNDSSVATSFSSGLRRRTSSVSLTVYQWSRLRVAAAAYANANSGENPMRHNVRRGLGNRSISGSCLPSPSRTIATQTPTEHFSFEFPSQGDGEREDVADRRYARPGSSWGSDCIRGRNRSMFPAFGRGILNGQSLPNDPLSRYSTILNWAEVVGQDLRFIADDFARSRSRSFSSSRRRSSS